MKSIIRSSITLLLWAVCIAPTTQDHCDYTKSETACRDHERRFLETSEIVSGGCLDQKYILSLHVRGFHILLAAKPSSLPGETDPDCPSLAFHITVDHKLRMEKVMEEMDEEELAGGGLELGTHTLERLVDAHAGASIGSGKQWNLWSNNCGSLLINMGRALKLDPTNPEILGFVSGQLSSQLSNANYVPHILIEELSKHDSGLELILQNEDEGAIIEAFLAQYVQARV